MVRLLIAMNKPDFSWNEVGIRIRDRRMLRSMSQQKLAEAAGITQNGIFRIEAGDTNPQLSTLRQIAEALGCSVRDLVIGVSESSPVLVDRLRRVKMIIESGDQATLRVIDNAIETAEALLERSGVRREVPPLKRVLKGEGRHSKADELRLMHGPVLRRSEVDAISGSAVVKKATKPFGDSRTNNGRMKEHE
jgi:transcriptional regulator with XRE-family HTH domain